MEDNRRNFIKKTTVGIIGVVAATIPIITVASNLKKIKKSSLITTQKAKINLNLGVASYTMRKFTTEEALDMTLRCGLNRISFKSIHLPLDSDIETINKTLALCKKKGVALYGGGVIGMETKEEVDQAFKYAKDAGMKVIISVPNPKLLPYIETKVKSYNIKLAIHNHGPEDKVYPSAKSAYDRIKHMDYRMGLCIDIGHTKRLNRNPEDDVKDYFDRIFDIHLKDVSAARADAEIKILGRGIIDFPTFLKTVSEMGYKGTLALEYEAEENDPLPGMAESAGYIKGILASL